MGCHSRSIKLVRRKDYDGNERLRPLSPVRIRTMLPEDIKVEAPPTLKMIHATNEAKVLRSPFISHKNSRDREEWLLKIGSIEKPKDENLVKELALQEKLSSIITPVKVTRRTSNLHKPKFNRMPERLQDEILRETEYLHEQEQHRLQEEEAAAYKYNNNSNSNSMMGEDLRYDNGSNNGYTYGGGFGGRAGGADSPITIGNTRITRSEKSFSSQGAVMSGIIMNKKQQQQQQQQQQRRQKEEDEEEEEEEDSNGKLRMCAPTPLVPQYDMPSMPMLGGDGMYVFILLYYCSSFLFLFVMSLSLLSIYYCLPAFSDIT